MGKKRNTFFYCYCCNINSNTHNLLEMFLKQIFDNFLSSEFYSLSDIPVEAKIKSSVPKLRMNPN